MGSTRPSLARLSRIHHTIAEDGYPSVADLAALCEVDARTIKRDIQFMRDELNAPVRYVRERRGYVYDAPFSFDRVRFTEGEELALCFMLTMGRSLRNTHLAARFDHLCRKLRDLLPDTARPLLDAECSFITCMGDPAPPERVEDAIHFNYLLHAIEECRQVRLTYRALSREREETRIVDPWQFYYFQGLWYVHGFCRLRQATRDFALQRIRQVEVLPTTFPPPDRAAIKAQLDQRFANYDDATPVEVRIRFAPAIAPRIRERIWHPTQTLADHLDGACTLAMTITGLPAVLPWLLTFGRHARVEAPPELARMVEEEVRAMAEQLRGETTMETRR